MVFKNPEYDTKMSFYLSEQNNVDHVHFVNKLEKK